MYDRLCLLYSLLLHTNPVSRINLSPRSFPPSPSPSIQHPASPLNASRVPHWTGLYCCTRVPPSPFFFLAQSSIPFSLCDLLRHTHTHTYLHIQHQHQHQQYIHYQARQGQQSADPLEIHLPTYLDLGFPPDFIAQSYTYIQASLRNSVSPPFFSSTLACLLSFSFS